MLLANRRVGEAFDICASDAGMVICSLRVNNITSHHNIRHKATELWAEIGIFEDKNECSLSPIVERNGTQTIHAGDRFELLDKGERNVIGTMVVLEIKEHQNEHFYEDRGIERGRGARVTIGFDFPGNIAYLLIEKNNYE